MSKINLSKVLKHPRNLDDIEVIPYTNLTKRNTFTTTHDEHVSTHIDISQAYMIKAFVHIEPLITMLNAGGSNSGGHAFFTVLSNKYTIDWNNGYTAGGVYMCFDNVMYKILEAQSQYQNGLIRYKGIKSNRNRIAL